MKATSSQHSGTATTTLAKPKSSGVKTDTRFSWGADFPKKIRTGDTEINLPLAQVLGNFRRREKRDFNIFDALQLAVIATIGTYSLYAETGSFERFRRLLHQTALGGNGKSEHLHASTAFRRSV